MFSWQISAHDLSPLPSPRSATLGLGALLILSCLIRASGAPEDELFAHFIK